MENFNPELLTIRQAEDADVLAVAPWIIEHAGWALADVGLLKAIGKAFDGIVAEYDGEPVGYASMAELNADLSICPDIIVKEGFRSRGIGKLLMEKAIEKLGATTIMIHAAITAENFYKRFGFSNAGCYRQTCQGNIKCSKTISPPPGTISFLKGEAVSVEEIASYEANNVGLSLEKRRAITRELSDIGCRYAAVVDGKVSGVLIGHSAPFRKEKCWSIDTLVADSDEIAISLVDFAMKDYQDCTLFVLSFPTLHDRALKFIDVFQMEKLRDGPTMFNKDTGRLNCDLVYSISPVV